MRNVVFSILCKLFFEFHSNHEYVSKGDDHETSDPDRISQRTLIDRVEEEFSLNEEDRELEENEKKDTE